MRSRELALTNYDTDKVVNQYLERYDVLFAPLVAQPVRLLELGVHRGGSVRLWADYFPHGRITGIDLRLPSMPPHERIELFEGNQADTAFLTRVAEATAPAGYDVIIDDASHFGELTRLSFWHLFERHLKPGGVYAIEDWGTGYWEDWPDGKRLDLRSYATATPARRPLPCHAYGMVGFVKQLVDEQAAVDVTKGRFGGTPERSSRFAEVIFTSSIVFVRKAAAPTP